MPDPEIHVRPATPADFEAIERVAVANDEPTTAPLWPGWLYLDHLAAEATLLVAERAGAIVGYAGAAGVGGRRPAAHVTDLFVDPAAHGSGAGGRLLRELLARVDVPDWTTSSSSDPRALTLYVRAGMRPLWPILYLDAPLANPGLELASGGRTATSRLVTPAEASDLERAWSGRDFATHYRHWSTRPGGVAFLVELRGRPVAVGAVRDGRTGPGRVLDHLAVAPDADAVVALPAALASDAVRGSFGAPAGSPEPEIRLRFAIAGPSSAVPLLLANGVRIADHDTFCATDPGLVDPERIVPDPSFG